MNDLRLWYKEDNSPRQNDVLQLKEYTDFVMCFKIKDRGEVIIDMLLDRCLLMSAYNPNLRLTSELRVSILPKMNKLIEYGVLQTWDRLYITFNSNDSEATLFDRSYVDFKGENMKVNDWGCRVIG